MGRMTKTKRPMTVSPSVTGRNQIRGATERKTNMTPKFMTAKGGGARLRTAVLHRTRAARPRDVQARGGDAEGLLQTTFRKVKCLAVVSTGPVIEYAYSAGHEDVAPPVVCRSLME